MLITYLLVSLTVLIIIYYDTILYSRRKNDDFDDGMMTCLGSLILIIKILKLDDQEMIDLL